MSTTRIRKMDGTLIKSDVTKAADALAAASRLLRKSEASSGSDLVDLLKRREAAEAAAADDSVAAFKAEIAPDVEQALAARAQAVAFETEHGPYLATLGRLLDSASLSVNLRLSPILHEFETFRRAVAAATVYATAISTIDRVIRELDRLTPAELTDFMRPRLLAEFRFELAAAVGCADDLKRRIDDVKAEEPRIAEYIKKYAPVTEAN